MGSRLHDGKCSGVIFYGEIQSSLSCTIYGVIWMCYSIEKTENMVHGCSRKKLHANYVTIFSLLSLHSESYPKSRQLPRMRGASRVQR